MYNFIKSLATLSIFYAFYKLPTNELLCQLFLGLGSNEFHINEYLAPMAVEKIKILVAVFGATS